MSSNEQYNGWSNYATWRVNLEILDDYVSSLVGDGPQWTGVQGCADELTEIVDEALTGYGTVPVDAIALDYARAFVSDVNFREIAETILTDNPELFTDAHHFGYYCECPECQGE